MPNNKDAGVEWWGSKLRTGVECHGSEMDTLAPWKRGTRTEATHFAPHACHPAKPRCADIHGLQRAKCPRDEGAWDRIRGEGFHTARARLHAPGSKCHFYFNVQFRAHGVVTTRWHPCLAALIKAEVEIVGQMQRH